ncbi:MAG: hypothetical protein Ct9H300mP26_5660 [Acidimicrobiales bacterium]|nr:MAG: hypothetical protein Ct9H300mP26_5660 [Acidimicrobiales bacterium]
MYCQFEYQERVFFEVGEGPVDCISKSEIAEVASRTPIESNSCSAVIAGQVVAPDQQ